MIGSVRRAALSAVTFILTRRKPEGWELPGGGRLHSAALTVLLTLGLAISAVAAVGDYGGYSYDAVNIRAWSTVSSTSYGLGYQGHVACLTFYQEGDYVNGDPWWIYHRNFSTGVEGYSHSEYLYFDVPYTQCNW